MNQVLFCVGEPMDLLSNWVWSLFLLRIDGEIKENAWELKVTNGGDREGHSSVLGWAEWVREKKRDVGEGEDMYKYPLSPNSHLSHGSAVA